MAVFENNEHSKLSMDDTVALTCIFQTAHSVKDHIEYTIQVQRGLNPEHFWQIQKRYSDFAALDECYRALNVDLPIPPKKVFGTTNREFVAERQAQLQTFINKILGSLFLSSSLHIKNFLDEKNYEDQMTTQALQSVSMLFRSETHWDVVETLPDIGWRYRKEYILVKPVDNPKQRSLLSWSAFGPFEFIPNKELIAIFRLFPSIQHHNIYPTKLAVANEVSGMVIRDYLEGGTLRDHICRCKPRANYVKKYACPRQTSVLPLAQIKALGRQVLLALKFLHDKGWVYCHLHAGNIVLENGMCRFLELENWILGLPSLYRPYFIQFRKIQTCELVDVYCFGHLLYEMVFGQQLNSPVCDVFPPNCPAEIRSVLESILTTEACKRGLPTLEFLLTHPLFYDVQLPVADKPHFKFPSKLKESIKVAKGQYESKLQAEQKLISQYRRLSKAKEFHMSENEKIKRRRSKKKALDEEGEASPGSTTPPRMTKSGAPLPVVPEGPASSARPAPPPAPPSAPPMAPPPMAPPPPPPPPLNNNKSSPAKSSPGSSGNTALLSSIRGFGKGGLRKAAVNDKSGPNL